MSTKSIYITTFNSFRKIIVIIICITIQDQIIFPL